MRTALAEATHREAFPGWSPPSLSTDDRVAVFMPTRGCRRWIDRAIDSVIAQSWGAVELYVVADDCDDIDDSLVARCPDVHFLRTRRRVGPYQIANVLLELCDSEFVAFHDSDDRSHPERVATQLAMLDTARLAGVGAWSRLEDPTGEVIAWETYAADASAAARAGDPCPALHPSMIYRREVFATLGGFDAGTIFGADSEFIQRAATTFPLGNVQRFLYFRMAHPEALTQSRATGFASEARQEYLARLASGIDRARVSGAPPPPCQTLFGTAIAAPPRDLLYWLRRGTSTRTLRHG